VDTTTKTSVTINAHQLMLLLDKTADHIADDSLEILHGVRLDVDSQYLYAVASDRYTIAAARYRLNTGDQNQEPWARTIPGDFLPALRSWLATTKGSENITVSTAEDRLVFGGPLADLTVATKTVREFPDWRGLLRGIASQSVDGDPFPALNTFYFPRWAGAGQSLRTRVTADRKAVLFIGEDFIGAQMPSRGGSIGPAEEQTFADAHGLWLWTLSAGATDIDMASLPAPEPNRWGATHDVRETADALLKEVISSTSDVFHTDYVKDDPDAWLAHIRSGVASWSAYRYLDALYQVDPRAAQKVVDETAEQLDDGELGVWAWDLAKESGFDPEKWQAEHETARTKREAERPPLWATRLAHGLNAAQKAGITFRVEANDFVSYDDETSEWKPTAPKPAA
jgi:hypothetical protein